MLLLSSPTITLTTAHGRERCGLAKLATLVVLQVGLDFPDVQRCLHPLGTVLAQDNTILPVDRAEVCVCVICSITRHLSCSSGDTHVGLHHLRTSC